MRQAVVWSKAKRKLTQKDKAYKINQVLMYGDLAEIKNLIASEGLAEIKQVFINQPTKIYTKPAFNFIKNHLLKINQDLDQAKYVKTLY